MNPNLDTLVTSLYVTIDDAVGRESVVGAGKAAVGHRPQAVRRRVDHPGGGTGFVGIHFQEARFLRYAHAHLKPWFPYLPTRTAYNKRLRPQQHHDVPCHGILGPVHSVLA